MHGSPALNRNKKESRKAQALMVVGTTSNAGKSIIAAALCRHFANEGIDVAPFKAQNMALNSFVTKTGGEMGRAQAVQADAARVTPHTDMNPVLLKPQGNASCQVIINGKAVANFSAGDFYARKKEFARAAHEAFDRLASKHELIVIEGAGSPAEINLFKSDFVNMRMAEYAKAPTILVADIDRGGVFASIYGTIRLLPPRWRKLIRGVVINKFRGDKSLLGDGVGKIEKLSGVPVLGVMPFLRDLHLPDEDALNLEGRTPNAKAIIDIAVIHLPHISNFTDFISLENTPGVGLRYAKSPHELGHPDIIIIPGTKNTISDMRYLRESGFAALISAAADNHIPIVGICGGYQILGKRILDPDGIEGPTSSIDGLGLLPINTTMEKEKELAQVSGKSTSALPFARPGTKFSGYEIHAGRSIPAPRSTMSPLLITKRRETQCSEAAGHISRNGLVFGSYVHGLFDSPELRTQFIKWLAKRKGLSPAKISRMQDTVEENPFDRLAKELSTHLDLKEISRWLHLPKR